MTIILNGESHDVAEKELTIEGLITSLDLSYPVLVELNGEAILKRHLGSTDLHEGDRVELVRMVAGG